MKAGKTQRRRLMRAATAVGCAGVLALGLGLGAGAAPAGSGVAAGGTDASSAATAAGAPWSGPAQAWADNPTNEAVPTDDTGVVDPSAGKDDQQSPGAGGQPGQGGDAAAGQPGDQQPPTLEEGADGTPPDDAEEAPSEGEDGESAAAMPKPIIPDPVFGSGVNPDNLVNPQQKPDSSFIYDTSISALQDADSYLNNQTVQVTGEVVGDRIKAEFDPGYCWIVLQSNDNSYAEVPVFISVDATLPIDMYGSYGRKGTTLQVRGIFHLSCSDHEGLTDLHADTVTAVEKGSVTQQTLDPAAFAPGAVLVGVGLVMLLVFRHMREGRR
ncbi:hypothetical protein VIN30_02630 [Adlercreutzia sp. R7]|uniref:Hydrolase n=1 Tax=Adlercreutzia wanghongyangiae TaxID=3111451 RepID=A0ABU6IG12_9ACTN|nr:hypothetical protein [Adlercreutzia sp. R7]